MHCDSNISTARWYSPAPGDPRCALLGQVGAVGGLAYHLLGLLLCLCTVGIQEVERWVHVLRFCFLSSNLEYCKDNLINWSASLLRRSLHQLSSHLTSSNKIFIWKPFQLSTNPTCNANPRVGIAPQGPFSSTALQIKITLHSLHKCCRSHPCFRALEAISKTRRPASGSQKWSSSTSMSWLFLPWRFIPGLSFCILSPRILVSWLLALVLAGLPMANRLLLRSRWTSGSTRVSRNLVRIWSWRFIAIWTVPARASLGKETIWILLHFCFSLPLFEW